MNPHVSDYAVGARIPLDVRGDRAMTAVLHRRELRTEEWRIENARGRYVFSEGFRFVTQYRTDTP